MRWPIILEGDFIFIYLQRVKYNSGSFTFYNYEKAAFISHEEHMCNCCDFISFHQMCVGQRAAEDTETEFLKVSIKAKFIRKNTWGSQNVLFLPRVGRKKRTFYTQEEEQKEAATGESG